MKLWEDRLLISHHDLSWDEKLKNGIGECQVILVAKEIEKKMYEFASLVLHVA